MAGPKTRGGSPPALGSIEGPHVRAGWLNLGFTTRESSTQKPRITISITIIAFFIVELVDAAGLLVAASPRACSAAVAPHHHGYGAYMAPPPST